VSQNSPSLPKFEIPLVVNQQTNKNWYFFFQSLTTQLLTSVGLDSTDLTINGSPLTGAGVITANLKTQPGVNPGNYPGAQITVNSKGIITGISSSQNGGSVTSIGLTSTDLVVTGASPITTKGAWDIELDVQAGVTAGAFTLPAVTVNSKGIVTAIANGIVSVADSITGTGQSASPLILSGDAATPGNNFFYGTNASGAKGWYATPQLLFGASTVAALPATPTQGARAFVTDATATLFLSIVAGGGTNKVPVVYDGTNWVIG
jgi:hypothetical protein